MTDRRVMRLCGVPVRADVFTARVYARLAPDGRRRVKAMATRSVSVGKVSLSLGDTDGSAPPIPGMDVAQVSFHADGAVLSCEVVLERTTPRGRRPILNDRDIVWVGTPPQTIATAAVGRDAAEVTGIDLLSGKTITNVELATAFVRMEYDRRQVDLMDPAGTNQFE